MPKALLVTFLLTAATSPLLAAPASPLDDPGVPGNDRYARCLSIARSRPQEALAAANAWQTAGGADAAVHCQAMALVSLRRYSEAADRLDRLASNVREQPAMRAQLFDQSGNAWLLAHQPASAERAFSAAIALLPGDPELLADRARARAMLQNWAGADSDLTAALALAPMRADLLVLRSSARHAEGRKDGARADIDRALQISPGYAEALVERGVMKLESGDTAGAQSDWQQAVNAGPNSDAAAAARGHLQDLQRALTSMPPASGAH